MSIILVEEITDVSSSMKNVLVIAHLVEVDHSFISTASNVGCTITIFIIMIILSIYIMYDSIE